MKRSMYFFLVLLLSIFSMGQTYGQTPSFNSLVGTWTGTNRSQTTGYSVPATMTLPANGGTLGSDFGTSTVICRDGVPDPVTVTNSSSAGLSYAYIITDSAGIVLGYPGTNIIDLDGAPAGICRVYGINFEGTLNMTVGIPVANVTASGSYDLSDNYIAINRTDADGGTLGSDFGTTPVICRDGVPDPVTVTNSSASALNYAYIITDGSGNVLGFPGSNVVDFDGAPAGVCRVYGISYAGILDTTTGIPVGDVDASGCFDLSDNYIAINRVTTEGGSVKHEDGFTEISICLDANPDPIPMIQTSGETNQSYAFVITDDTGTVLAFPAGSTIDLNGAPPGICRIYGIGYAGTLDTTTGVAIESVTASDCSDLSTNYVLVIRENTGTPCNPESSVAGQVHLNPEFLTLPVKTMYGVSYMIESTTDLMSDSWHPMMPGFTGNGEMQDVIVPIVPANINPTFRIIKYPGNQTGKIVVANRGSGSISVIAAHTGVLITTIPLPQGLGENIPQPMYVVYAGEKVFVGDRSNNRVVAFDANDFTVIGTVPAGNGIFHMWADPLSQQLWVNNDIDDTATVIDPHGMNVLATVPMPADLVALGGLPHDVVLDPEGKRAFVSMLGIPGTNDYVVQFSTVTFTETGRAPVGKDPHLSISPRNRLLYAPSQGSSSLHILDMNTLARIDVLSIPGAHGAGMAFNGKTFYTANISGGGTDALFTVDTLTNEVIGEPTDAPYATPHNIALTPFADKLFLSHSGGAANKVTFYDVSAENPVPVYAGEVTVGLNPFGISYVP